MPPPAKPKSRTLWLIVITALAAAIILPGFMAGGLGRVLADVWVSTMAAIAGLIGGIFAS